MGTPVTMTGVSLTQTSKVTFGGVKATTAVVNSDTQVTANVPTGAKTGEIAITTPGGVVTSAAIHRDAVAPGQSAMDDASEARKKLSFRVSAFEFQEEIEDMHETNSVRCCATCPDSPL